MPRINSIISILIFSNFILCNLKVELTFNTIHISNKIDVNLVSFEENSNIE